MSTKKYYDSQNNEVDNSELLELSEILGISTEAAAEREGYTTNFQTDPLKKNGASAGSSNTAPNGDLGSVNTSSASQGDAEAQPSCIHPAVGPIKTMHTGKYT